MKLIFYLFLFSQLLNFLGVFAEKVKESSSGINPAYWEKVRENKSKPLKKVIWKSYKGDENYFKNENKEGFSINQVQEIESTAMESSIWRNRTLRFSFEEIDMPDAGEFMGLYSMGAYEQLNSWLYGGITLYGAATGRRGGFFTGGYTLGLERQLFDKFIFDAGAYVGAGGGGAAAQGGGLMIRPHVGLKYDFSWSKLGLNYAYVDFPNGNISSDAIALSLDIPFSSLILNLEDDGLTVADYFGVDWSNVSRHRSHLAARVRTYSPVDRKSTRLNSSH